MTFVRPARRVLIAAVSLSALLLAAACGGGGTEAPPAASASGDAEYDKKGPITYTAGKDATGYVQKRIDRWNKDHPDEKVTFLELSESADQQRQQMLQNAQIKSDKQTVLSMDVVWTAEFAANGVVDALPEGSVDTSPFLPATVDSATYFNKLYAFPNDSDGGLLYYRKDLLEDAGLEVPKTWTELKAACDKIKAKAGNEKLDCYAGQHDKYEGGTVNFAETVNSAGGVIVGPDGKPNVNTPEAKRGLDRLQAWFKDGTIPEGALTWKEENGRTAFQAGTLIFHRNWGYVYARATNDASSKIKGKFDVAALPGEDGPGVSSLGGHNLAIAKYGKNKGTAVEFAKWWSSEEEMKQNALINSSSPTIAKLYSDPELVAKFPYYPKQLESIENAQPRPKAVKYGDVTLAIQDALYTVEQGGDTQAALTQLQTKLESLVK